jgi:hypothetical protein
LAIADIKVILNDFFESLRKLHFHDLLGLIAAWRHMLEPRSKLWIVE